MRPREHASDDPNSYYLSLFACHYIRYVLLRCLAYTNDRAVGQRLATYTLITACLSAGRLFGPRAAAAVRRRKGDLGLVVETVMQIVATDWMKGGKRRRKGGGSDKRQVTGDGSDKREVTGDKKGEALLGADACGAGALDSSQISDFQSQMPQEAGGFLLPERMCAVAGVVNALGRFEREVLVLHHVEGLAAPVLADLNRVAVPRIEQTLAKAEGDFVALLRERASWDHEVDPDVHGVLQELAGCLNEKCRQAVADGTLRYLARYRRRKR